MGFRQIEWIIRAKVMAGLETIRATPALIDTMFPDLSTSSRDQLRTWLLKTDISFLLAFPRGTTDPPFWCLTMVGEQPVYKPIGTIMESSVDGSGNVVEDRGEFVRKGYQIHTVTTSPDTMVVLAAILQHILKSMIQDLTNEGFYEISTAQEDAVDFKLDYLPNFVFSRVTYLSVLTEDTFVGIDTQATSVAIGHAGAKDSDGYIDLVFP